MKLSCHYTMRAQKRLPIHVPFDLCVEGISAVGTNIEQVVDRYALKLEGPVDHREIEYVEEPVELLGGGTICNKGLRTDATKRFSGIANFVCRYLSFACQIPVSLSGSLGRNGLTPETDDDQEFLSQFPTDRLYEGIKMTGGDVWSVPMLISAEQNIEYFRQREVGLAIYADSLRVSEPVAMFRELWRVLESAFGQKDDDLVRSLKRFEPLAGIGSVDGELTPFASFEGEQAMPKVVVVYRSISVLRPWLRNSSAGCAPSLNA
ncbi:MAG: hypothetical protein HQ518_18940 [Rhodopirellula sp.]|nr:hypothetical protein [Rhodopirellula sp.]